MTEQQAFAMAAAVVSLINVWGFWIINTLSKRVETLATICGGLISRAEVDKRFEDVYTYVSARADGEAKARHDFSNAVMKQLLDHHADIAVLKDRQTRGHL